ncbi:MAG: NADPH:quinone oxidoreductase family protein [Acidimicrobiia bacterium]|nr:NADPH:quinone oxidoreductase family protein [Acidimicrobiia bacterium]
MRAWQVRRHGRPDEVLEWSEREMPSPGPGRLRVRVVSAAIGLPDAFMCAGSYAFSPRLPFVPGQEVCGVVEAVGEGTTVPVGARVMGVTDFFDGHGGLAEYCLMGETSSFVAPDGLDDDRAACFRIGYSTAWIGLVRRGAVQPGETVLVLGAAGGSGAAAIEVARALGARVIAVVSDAARAEFVTRLGAERVIDRTAGSLVDAVREATDGGGVDVVFDPVGGALASEAMRTLVSGGRFLAVGFASGAWARPETAEMVRANWSFIGVYAGAVGRADNEIDQARLLDLVDEGRLRPSCTVVGVSEVPAVVQQVADGRMIGKVVVRMGEQG